MYLFKQTCLNILAVFYLVGCETGPKNIQVVCEVQDENQVIQVVNYEVDSYHWNPHVAGHFELLGAIYKPDKNARSKHWLLVDISSDKEYFKKNICTQSIIKNGAVIISPIKLITYIDKSIPWGRQEDRGDDLNTFIFKSGDKDFLVRKAPKQGPPYLVDEKGVRLSRSSWINRSFDYKEGVLTAVQVDFLKKPHDSYYEKGDYTTPYRYLEGRGLGCPECEPIIMREMVSHDEGRSWKLGDNKVIDINRLPKDVTITLEYKS